MITAKLKIDVRKIYLECQCFWFSQGNDRKKPENHIYNFAILESEKRET